MPLITRHGTAFSTWCQAAGLPGDRPSAAATTAERCIAGLEEAGLRELVVPRRLDCFAGSAKPETRKVAASFGAHGIVLSGLR